jgi:Immunoglobulin domain
LAAGISATIRIPVNASVSSPPATVGLFSLNETTGLWTQEGTATLVGSGASAYYQATVTHFSYWSVGSLINTVVVSGQVCNADGSTFNPTTSTTEKLDVVAAGTDYIGSSFATVASNGSFSVTVKQNAEADIQLMNRQQEPLTFTSVATETSNISLPSCLRLPAPAPELPVIATQPQSKSIALNTQTVLTVALANAAAAGLVNYQWYQDDVLIPNATSASYTTPVFSSTTTSHSYYVTITNDTGTVPSNTVQVSVNTSLLPPSITSQPVAQTALVGQTATFSVALDSTPPASTYQWFKDGATISGATAASYTTPVLTLADNGKRYSVRVTNSNGFVDSASALLTVNAAATTADEATIRKVARFVPLNTVADNLGNGFNFLVNNGSATVLPSIIYDPFFCSPYRSTTIQVNGNTLAQYAKVSFSAGPSYALNIQFPSPSCTTNAQLGGLTLTGNLSTTFSYTGVNTPQNYNYTHNFSLSNASITLPNASASQAMQASGLWFMFEERKANTTLTSRTFEPKTNAALNDLSTGLTATVSAGQIKTTVDENTQGTTTTVTYVTPTTITVDGVAYTASGQYTLVVSAQGGVSRTGSLLLKRNGSTVAEIYPNDAGTGLVVKVNNGAPSAL